MNNKPFGDTELGQMFGCAMIILAVSGLVYIFFYGVSLVLQ